MTSPSSPTASSSTTRYKVAYKKTPGTLYLTDTTISYRAEDRGSGVVVGVQQLSRVLTIFQSKVGAAKTSIKITFTDDVPEGGLLFVFTGERVPGSAATTASTDPAEIASADKAAVVEVLTAVVQANNERRANAASSGKSKRAREDDDDDDIQIIDNPSTNPYPSPATTPGGPSTPSAGPSKAPKLPRLSSGGSGSSRAGTPQPGGGGTAVKARPVKELFDLRRQVLVANADLKKLYIDLVVNDKGLSEEDFWSGREHLVQQQALLTSQVPGRSSRLLDDRFDLTFTKGKGKASTTSTGHGVAPSASGGGVKTVAVGKDLMEEIFEEFPVVREIYADNVGGEGGLTETEFWQRYFKSTLWERHRASTRPQNPNSKGDADQAQIAPQKKDEVFDRYLVDADDELEPRVAPTRNVDMFLDLAATEEDHQETGNTNDYTMQAGKTRSTLPLIRRFNEHSNRLVARDEEEASEQSADARLYSEIELDDLRGPRKETTYPLNVQDNQDQFNNKGSGRDETDPLVEFANDRSAEELEEIIVGERNNLIQWQPNLPKLVLRLPEDHPVHTHHTPGKRPDLPAVAVTMDSDEYNVAKRVGREALRHVAEGIMSGIDASRDRDPIPDDIMSQILSCHNAACEFLRQFWSAVLPNVPGTLGSADPDQKLAKASKMADYLGKTQGKVDAVVKTAEAAGIEDVSRVKDALEPTLIAVRKALAQHASMQKKLK